MDDKLILKMLTTIPPEGWHGDRIPIDDITPDMLHALRQYNLLHYSVGTYYPTVAGNEWVRNYHAKKRQSKMAWASLVLVALAVFFAAVAAYQNLLQLGEWIVKWWR